MSDSTSHIPRQGQSQSPSFGLEDALRCAGCNGECLHPIAVYVIARNDGGAMVNTIAIDVQDRGCAERTFPQAAIVEQIPSTRGTTIARLYVCEFCPATSIFTESFHKGTTYLTRQVAS